MLLAEIDDSLSGSLLFAIETDDEAGTECPARLAALERFQEAMKRRTRLKRAEPLTAAKAELDARRSRRQVTAQLMVARSRLQGLCVPASGASNRKASPGPLPAQLTKPVRSAFIQVCPRRMTSTTP